MAQIFVSHSKKDKDIVNYFGKLFDTNAVKCIFKEIEGFKTEQAGIEIKSDIQSSRAIFILSSLYVNDIMHTRDWVVTEGAIGAALNKDVWLFEPYEFLGKINIILPHINHYMVYQQNGDYEKYIKTIIDSYDDSNVIPAFVIGGVLGVPLGPLGPPIGSALAVAASDPGRNRPFGIPIKCDSCKGEYRIHVRIPEIRCPMCNATLKVDWNRYEKQYNE